MTAACLWGASCGSSPMLGVGETGHATSLVTNGLTSSTVTTRPTWTSLSSTISDLIPTARSTWASSDSAIVEVSASGQLTAVAAGAADVTATWLGRSAIAHVTVVGSAAGF